MASIQSARIEDKLEWEDFIKNHPEANFLHSWYFGEFHNRLGKHIERRGFYKDGELSGVALAVVEPAKRGRYLTVAGGPILNWSDKTVLSEFVSETRAIARKERCVFVRVRPQLIENDLSKAIFRQYGFRQAPMHLTADLTSQLDLAKTEQELFSSMRKSTRYEIRNAHKEGLQVTVTKDEEAIKEFYQIQLDTAKRHKFVPFSLEFLYHQFKVFAQDDLALLYRAYLNKELLSEAIIIFYGTEATYHYGASTEEGRKHPGSYLIQWEAIREAKQRGMRRYNFWGVEPLSATKHRFWGVSLFKRGFGGQDVQYLHAQDLIIDPIRYYAMTYPIEVVRKKLRRL
ncbi:peptidoglycan bridge formation glycyltransferase FemA/FemB family protein [Candidatus Roizmanbacteria bacterium]|nr:peptidoglycan bridge formation glycyltransferase FemA/FemB family protein [Candidatus Roizmanbacteria bacterium]